MGRARGGVSIPVLLVVAGVLGTQVGCPEEEDQGYWLEVEQPAASYEVGVVFELAVRYGYRGPLEGDEQQSFGALIDGDAVAFALPQPTWPHEKPAALRQTTLRLMCTGTGANQKLTVLLAGTYLDYETEATRIQTVKVEVTINCGATGEGGGEESFALGAVEFGSSDYFDAQLDIELDGETFHWKPQPDAVPPIAVDGQTPAPTPDPTTGFGSVDEVPHKVVVVTRTQLQTFCDAYEAELPSGLSTRMLATCDALLVGGPTPCTGSDCPQGVVVEACDYVSAADAAAVLGNPVTYFIEPLENSEDFIRCAYSGDDNDVDWTFSADLYVFRATHSLVSVDSRLFTPQTVPSADFIVINDDDGIMTDVLNAGVVDIGTRSYPISMGTADPALGGLTVMSRGSGVKVLSFLDGYDIAIQVDIWDNQPTDPVDPAPSRAEFESHALELAHRVFSAVTSAQTQ